MMKKGNMQMQDTCYLRGLLPPQASLLTGWRVIPVVLVECLSVLILLLQQFHGGFMICLLLCVISFGVLNMLSESSVGLLCPIINVVDSDVDVVYPLREITITSSWKWASGSKEWGCSARTRTTGICPVCSSGLIPLRAATALPGWTSCGRTTWIILAQVRWPSP